MKYLGVVIDEGPISSSDIDRCINSFLSQFNFMYYNFFRISDEKLKAYLFNSYCTSFFGIETWYDILLKPGLLRKISVAYHKAIKKLCGMMVWESNHLACEKMNLYIFSHLLLKIHLEIQPSCHSYSSASCNLMQGHKGSFKT